MKNKITPFKLKPALQKPAVSGQFLLADIERELIDTYEKFLERRKPDREEIKIAYALYSDIFNKLVVEKVGR